MAWSVVSDTAGSRGGRDVVPAVTDMDLNLLVAGFGSEEKARAYLERLRWPDGVHCPRCDADRGISRIERRGQFDCDSCGYQFSVRVGTIFHASHLPLWKWLLAVYLMCESNEGVSANQLKRVLGISYKSAWYLCHRIRTAMKDEMPEGLRRIVDASRLQDKHARIEGRDLNEAPTPGGRANPVWSAFRRSVAGSYHHLSPKHLSAYLDESAFRYKNRNNAYLFRDTLLRLIDAGAMPYSELVGDA